MGLFTKKSKIRDNVRIVVDEAFKNELAERLKPRGFTEAEIVRAIEILEEVSESEESTD